MVAQTQRLKARPPLSPEQALVELRVAYAAFTASALAVLDALELAPADPALPANNLRFVVETVARYYRVTPEDIVSQSRLQEIVVPRHMAIHLCAEFVPVHRNTIGRYFGFHHSAITYALRKFPTRIQVEPRIMRDHATLCVEIAAHLGPALGAPVVSVEQNAAGVRP